MHLMRRQMRPADSRCIERGLAIIAEAELQRVAEKNTAGM